MTADVINLKDYRLPNDKLKVTTLYPRIPVNRGGVHFDIFDYNYLFNDKDTLELIRRGKTIGCFYIESPGMRSLLRRLDVTTFEMLTAASSVIRPGVAESGMMQEFIARHRDPKKRKYLIPEMEHVLNETYGIMIYQEDVIKVAHEIAGLPLEEADLLRRAMSGKMRSKEAMDVVTSRFFESCRRKRLPEDKAKELWRQIESFAGYAFCKAHSASFALLSFQVAYLKAHYPAEFLAGVLSNRGGYYAPGVYVQEAKRMGLNVKLPCVNRSEYEYKGKSKEIRIGLMAVKNLSLRACGIITAERKENGKFRSLADFIVRTKLGTEETAMLIRCGAMDCFKEKRTTLLRLLDIYMKRRRLAEDGYCDLFMNETFQLEEEVKADTDYSTAEKCRLEYEAFDYMVSRHPLEFFDEHTKGKKFINAADLPKHHGRRVKLIGWYMASKRIKTKKGDIMKFLSLEDMTGTFEAVIFPDMYKKVADKTLSMGPYVIEGLVDAAGGDNVITEKLDLIYDNELKRGLQKDSAEVVYKYDDGTFKDEDLYLSASLDQERLIKSYAG